VNDRAALWLVILGGMLVTYTTRLAFILLLPSNRLPAILQRSLRYVAPSVLAAIALPGFLGPHGVPLFSLSNHRLIAGGIAAVVAWRTGSTWLTIASGMAALWMLQSLA
jgi:branched-subunit amino acid transport protein